MTESEIFQLWAPAESIWSPWAKPVLFANLGLFLSGPPVPRAPAALTWLPPGAGAYALVVDLPGGESAQAGELLAGRGFRPVPLYNALPPNLGTSSFNPATGAGIAAVDVVPILQALRNGSETLARTPLPPTAPPAFLLDADRHGHPPVPRDKFDNRSICFTTDFPSATFLRAHGIDRAVLVQRGPGNPKPDLAHVLRRWQDGGICLELLAIENPSPSLAPFQAPRPSWYGAMFQRALAAFGLCPARDGGFGAWMPDSRGAG